MNKILVIGAGGMLGYAVSEYFEKKGFEVKELRRNEFDIANDSLEKLDLFVEGCDIVINCAGVIKPRIEEMSIEDVLKVNSVFPKNLARLCKSKKIKCIHITTDCVYSGEKGAYDEDDYFDAEDVYGMTKLAGENSNDCMILRTSIIGEEKNQSRSLLEWALGQKGKEVNGFTNHLWNGVTTVYLAEVIENIVNNQFYQEGLFHIHSPNTVDKYELLQIFNKVYDLELNINATEGGLAVDRSMSSKYDLSSKVATKTISEQVNEMRAFFEEKELLHTY